MPPFNRANAMTLHESAEKIATDESMEIEIGIEGIEVALLETQEMRGEAGTEIETAEKEIREIRETQEIHVEGEEDATTEMADEIETVRAIKMAQGMTDGTGEIEVSPVAIDMCWYIVADLMPKKMVGETNLASDQGLETTREDGAGAHDETESANRYPVAMKRPSPFPRLRRSSRRAEQPHHQ